MVLRDHFESRSRTSVVDIRIADRRWRQVLPSFTINEDGQMERTWRIEVLYRNGAVGYFCGFDNRGEPDLSSNREDALGYSDVIDAALDYAKIEGLGLSASIEVSKRFTGHSAAARLERFYAATLHAAE